MTCLLCNSTNVKFKFIFGGEDIYLKKLNIMDFDLKWYECQGCGVYFSEQYKNVEDVYKDEDLYDALYDKVTINERFNKIMNLDKKNSDNVKRVERCKDFHNNYIELLNNKKMKYNILDIGAGLGVFLAKFLDENYNGYALELNKVAVSHIENVLPTVNVYQDYMENLKIKNKFDLITLNRVLEHVINPINVMREVSSALVEDGLVYLELPDVFSNELDGHKNEAFASGHYMVYSAKAINYIFNEVGLILMNLNRVKEPSGKFTIYAIARKNNEVL